MHARTIKTAVTLGVCFMLTVVVSLVARAEVEPLAETTMCKWDFPWPRTVNYWIAPSVAPPTFVNGASDGSTRITYGGNTWSEAGLNIRFQRVWTMQQAENGYGPYRVSYQTVEPGSGEGDQDVIAEVYFYPRYSQCNRDHGKPLQQAVTRWSPSYRFWSDCKASGTQWCVQRHYFDIHNVSAHEFGHWLRLGHSPIPSDTMWGAIPAGEVEKRSLDYNDILSGWIMYGYR